MIAAVLGWITSIAACGVAGSVGVGVAPRRFAAALADLGRWLWRQCPDWYFSGCWCGDAVTAALSSRPPLKAGSRLRGVTISEENPKGEKCRLGRHSVARSSF